MFSCNRNAQVNFLLKTTQLNIDIYYILFLTKLFSVPLCTNFAVELTLTVPLIPQRSQKEYNFFTKRKGFQNYFFDFTLNTNVDVFMKHCV